MADTKCPHCGTMLTEPATQEFRTWPSEFDGSDHHHARCRDVLRAKLETATGMIEWMLDLIDDLPGGRMTEARAALEKLRRSAEGGK